MSTADNAAGGLGVIDQAAPVRGAEGTTRTGDPSGADGCLDATPHPDDAKTAIAPKTGGDLDQLFDTWSQDRYQRPLQRRAMSSRRDALAPTASFLAFDLLALRGHDVRDRPLGERRQLLEDLAPALIPPLQISHPDPGGRHEA